MLTRLHILHYAIIEELTIDFAPQLNIITGETGAGKSILMGALSLILGERADTSILQDKEKKCVVEGSFNAAALQGRKAIRSFFEEHELEWEEELLIRREISATGKSRAFVNDTPVNLSQLKQLAGLLVDLHQQFDTLELGDSDFQQEVLDALADNETVLSNYQQVYNQYQRAEKELETQRKRQAEANATLDYNRFLFDELEELNLQENELENMDAELKLLSNAESVKQQLSAVCFELSEAEQPIVQQLRSLTGKLQALAPYHGAIEGLTTRMQSAQLELKDIAAELEHINDTVQYNPDRIQLINERLSAGYKLQKKHGVTTTNELIGIKNNLQQQLDNILNIGESITAQEKEVAALLQQVKELSGQLSKRRHKAVPGFETSVNRLLAQVGMPNARFKVSLSTATGFHYTGADDIDFLFDGNKSDRFEPLRKVASGGELSRLMLCIKSLVAKSLQLPTLIFDEIDTGISGEAARQVGQIMKDLAGSHQLIAITHQPQIAARADAHYFVYKSIQKDRIVTAVKLLNNDERINAIAQMLSGEKPTAAALQNAREMLGN
jgi:DNA repair protein RecN (Recombination protein N)